MEGSNIVVDIAAISKMEGSGDIHHTICIDNDKSAVRKKVGFLLDRKSLNSVNILWIKFFIKLE
jgi:hypothetical protein